MTWVAARRHSLRAGLIAGVAIAMLAACGSDIGGIATDPIFENQTGTAVTLIWVRENADPIGFGRLTNGEKKIVNMNQFGNVRSVCSDGKLIAFDDRGKELTWNSPCSSWVITLPGTDGSRAPGS